MPRAASQTRSSGTSRVAAGAFGLAKTPTVLTPALSVPIQQEFPVPLCAGDRTFCNLDGEIQFFHTGAYFFARGLMEFRIAHDATFAHLSAADFELRLDQNYHASGFRPEDARDGRCDERGRDETDVADSNIDGLAKIGELEIAGIEIFEQENARVAAQAPVYLASARIDRMNFGRAVLEQAIGEAAGGGADIGADSAGGIDGEALQRGFPLEAAAADVTKPAAHFDVSAGGNGTSGLIGAHAIDENVSRHDEGAGLLAGFRETVFHHPAIEPDFLHSLRICAAR